MSPTSDWIHRPDFAGGSIANLMASIVLGLGGEETLLPPLRELAPQQLHAPTNVVLLVVDGLGHETLAHHGQGTSLLRHQRARMTSVFPSTTATAITTFLTGQAPRQHGLTGWHMYLSELAGVLAVLPGVPRGGGVPYRQAGIDPTLLLQHRPVFNRIPPRTYVVAPERIARSDFNTAHQGRAELRVYRTLEEMFAVAARTLREHAARKYLYLYWSEFDHIGHERGVNSREAVTHLAEIDGAFEAFLRRIAGTDTLVIATADHGMLDTTPATSLELADHPELADCLRLPLCGERRAPYCYLKPRREDAFLAYVREHLAEVAEPFASEALIADGWFGPGASHARLEERIGDYVLVMKENYVLKDWLPFEMRYKQIGVHGGVSPAEMYVPLILAEA